MQNLLIWKFGGTSVGDVQKIQRVASLIAKTVHKGHKLVVVVSAMGAFTDELLSLAFALNQSPPERELDMLVTTGERISSSLLSIALNTLGIPSISLTGSQCGILTDETHGNARIIGISGERLTSSLERVPVVIVAGFQGVSPKSKDITSLGRGGSDLSAVALAVRLGAASCEIYTDVPGVMTADPESVRDAELMTEIPWDIMCDYARKGAGVLHHRAADLAASCKLPLIIRSSFHPEQTGTRIEGESHVEEYRVMACAHRSEQCLLVITGAHTPEKSPTTGYQLYCMLQEWLSRKDEHPLVSQFYQDPSGFRLTLLLQKKYAEQAEGRLISEADKYPDVNVTCSQTPDCACISLIGTGFRQFPELLTTSGEIMGRDCLLLDLQDRCASFVIPGHKLDELLPKLHQLVTKSGKSDP